jgi:hypothetical protein
MISVGIVHSSEPRRVVASKEVHNERRASSDAGVASLKALPR